MLSGIHFTSFLALFTSHVIFASYPTLLLLSLTYNPAQCRLSFFQSSLSESLPLSLFSPSLSPKALRAQIRPTLQSRKCLWMWKAFLQFCACVYARMLKESHECESGGICLHELRAYLMFVLCARLTDRHGHRKWARLQISTGFQACFFSCMCSFLICSLAGSCFSQRCRLWTLKHGFALCCVMWSCIWASVSASLPTSAPGFPLSTWIQG